MNSTRGIHQLRNGHHSVTNTTPAISHLSYFFGGWYISSRKSPQLADLEMQCLCPYVTARVPLFPPRRNKKRLHGCSPFQGGGGWVRHHHRSYVLRTLRKATREEGGIGFHSFQLLQWVGGKSIPFIVARCGHLLQTAASPAVLILQCWSRRKKTDIPDTKQPS